MDTELEHLGDFNFPHHKKTCLPRVVQNEVVKVALRQATKDVDLALKPKN